MPNRRKNQIRVNSFLNQGLNMLVTESIRRFLVLTVGIAMLAGYGESVLAQLDDSAGYTDRIHLKNGDVITAGDHGVVMWDGVYNNQVGGANPGEGNRIAGHNNGVVVDANSADSIDNAILGNEIFSVNEMAIDLDNEQVTANDAGDIDSGPNDLLNHPELTGVTQDGADLDIDFDLDVELAGDYRIEFFDNPNGLDDNGFGQGERGLAQLVAGRPFHEGLDLALVELHALSVPLAVFIAPPGSTT